jgi:CBS domain-containing protein
VRRAKAGSPTAETDFRFAPATFGVALLEVWLEGEAAMQRIQKTISEIVIEGGPVPAMHASQTVAAAIDLMREQRTDGVLVVREGVLIGIFTGRDFVNRVAAEARDPESTLLADVMTPEPEALRTIDCVSYAINRMAVRGFRNIPVISDTHHPVALVSAHDVIEHLAEVLAELEGGGEETGPAARWVDIGGGG